MKITLAMVMSVDGKTTKGREKNVREWSSGDDQQHFQNLKSKNQVIIMGRKTYDQVKTRLKLSLSILRVIVTKYPEKFATSTVKEQLEFTSDTPEGIVDKLIARGYQKALLVGGHRLNAGFLRGKLVTDLVLTIEPVLFGEGLSLISSNLSEVRLQLISISQLNKQGTLVCRYKII